MRRRWTLSGLGSTARSLRQPTTQYTLYSKCRLSAGLQRSSDASPRSFRVFHFARNECSRGEVERDLKPLVPVGAAAHARATLGELRDCQVASPFPCRQGRSGACGGRGEQIRRAKVRRKIPVSAAFPPPTPP